MATERFIDPHLPYAEAGEHSHVSMASHRRRLDAVVNQLREWRQERTLAHEMGEDVEPINIDAIPQDQEIVLFNNA